MTAPLHPGEKFTISGVGYDAEGWLIVGGHRIDGRPGTAIRDHEWTMGDKLPVDSLPARVLAAVAAPRRLPKK